VLFPADIRGTHPSSDVRAELFFVGVGEGLERRDPVPRLAVDPDVGGVPHPKLLHKLLERQDAAVAVIGIVAEPHVGELPEKETFQIRSRVENESRVAPCTATPT